MTINRTHSGKPISRNDFLVRSTRWLLGGLLAGLGLFHAMKRIRLEREGGCIEYNTCTRCVEYKGCSKPEKV